MLIPILVVVLMVVAVVVVMMSLVGFVRTAEGMRRHSAVSTTQEMSYKAINRESLDRECSEI